MFVPAIAAIQKRQRETRLHCFGFTAEVAHGEDGFGGGLTEIFGGWVGQYCQRYRFGDHAYLCIFTAWHDVRSRRLFWRSHVCMGKDGEKQRCQKNENKNGNPFAM